LRLYHAGLRAAGVDAARARRPVTRPHDATGGVAHAGYACSPPLPAAPDVTQHRVIRDGLAASRLQLPPGPWSTVLQALCAHFPAIGDAVWRARFARGRVLDAGGQPLAVDAPYRLGAT